MGNRVVIVGGGLAGLAAAIRCAHAGYEVTLLEKNDGAGGKMNVIEEGGFLFDTGPTILTMPQVLHRLFESVGRRTEDYLRLIELDPQWRAFFEDGQVIDVIRDRQRMTDQIRRISPEDVAGYEKFRDYALRKYRLSERFFFWKSAEKLGDILRPGDFSGLKGWRILSDMDPLSTVSRAIDRHFKDPHLRQILEHFMQYVGSSPHQVPAFLCAIHHIQLEFGVWYPMGGMNRIASALIRLAQELGVKFLLGAQVERLITEGERVIGAQAAGRVVPADLVIANSDFVRSHRELLPSTRTLRRIHKNPKRYEPACSGLVIYFGLDRRYDNLWHHDFFFSKDPRKEFEDIYRRKKPTDDPTLCVCAPSRSDPSVAPPGCENVYVLVHTPYLQGGENWPSFYRPYRDLIIEKLERCGLPGFRKAIRVERWMTPVDLEQRYRVDRGAIYGIVSHGLLTGGFKPANRSKDFSNLYFCGGSVNPGPGVPMALMSGQIAANCLLEDTGLIPASHQPSAV
ncbi:MAG: phytoene desaturase family protein [Candidatus Omnitrophica bacterium]|nr:phytoene desaturase family protein [Candidatus Omnitrophota bacterium]